jgi:H+-transporting ATPase
MPIMIWIAVVIELALAVKYGESWADFGVLLALQIINGSVSLCVPCLAPFARKRRTRIGALTARALARSYEANKAGNAVAALKASLKPSAVCKRDGEWRRLDASLLVPGDLVTLGAGAAVPADCIVNGSRVQVDQAALTGESQPVKMARGGQPKMGSTVVLGEAEATVEHTGSATFLGKTAAMIQSVDSMSRFQKVLLRIMFFLIAISLVLCATVLGFLMSVERASFADAISFTVVLLVVSVPMAMEVVTTTTMAIGSHTLSTAGAIVARLSSIEELAGMNMLCSDKTGTLTLNRMVIQEEAPVFVEGLTQRELLRYAALATKWREPPRDALDTLVLGAVDAPSLSATYEQLDYMPFDATVKRTEGTVRHAESGEIFKVSKGAPHVIAALLDDAPGGEAIRAGVHDVVEALAARGVRSLAVARTVAFDDDERGATPTGEVQWQMLGLLTFLDPPRPDTKVTLQRAQAYGVAVKMITGDHVAIAKETARQLGIGTNILNAGNLPSLDAKGRPPRDLAKHVPLILGADGFAQVFPEHKFLIVEALRREGYAVGMTGDGVNDAPALKRADIGIAVQGSTDAARAAADIVLTSPGLSVVIDAITIARGIFRRMQNFVIYRVACTLQLLIFFFIAVICFQPSDYALGRRSSPHPHDTENVALAVFGPNGRPGGVVVMWHSTACHERTWDLAALRTGFGEYATGVSAADIAARAAAVPGSPESRLLRAGNGVALDVRGDTVTGQVCVEQWPRTFILPLLALILITLLNDGTIISIAYDNVQPSKHPEVWRLGILYLISGTLGVVALGGSLLYLQLLLDSHNPDGAWRRWGLAPISYGAVTAALYLKVSLSDFLTLFSARTTRWFFSVRPAWKLLAAAVVALSASTALAARWPRTLNGRELERAYLDPARFADRATFDALHKRSGVRMEGAPGFVLGVTWLYVVIWALVLDVIKFALYVALERTGVLRHVPDPKRPSGPCRTCELEGGAVLGAAGDADAWQRHSGETADASTRAAAQRYEEQKQASSS